MICYRKKKIIAQFRYKAHKINKSEITEISLNDYLEVAAICYRAAFSNKIPEKLIRTKTKEITPKFLHNCWADQRHGGMFDSKEKFMKWYKSRKWQGAHPFEIVYSTPRSF